jgi:RNA polymerase subunit RPABC4/transcription elongation factor Spt4
MKFANWEQKGKLVKITIEKDNENKISFNLPQNERLIDIFVKNTPKIFDISIILDFENFEEKYSIDFTHLKPIVKKTTKLSITLKKTTTETNNSNDNFLITKKIGRFSICRSESYKERFCSFDGWTQQTYYFDLLVDKDFELKKTEKQISPPQEIDKKINSNNNQEITSDLTKFQKLCINQNCGKIIDLHAIFCPYCNENQTIKHIILKNCINPKCLKEINNEAKFCPYCKANLSGHYKYCIKGHKNKINAIICIKCGIKFNN